MLLLATLEAAALGEAAEPPSVEREFRAAWIATVANIDWPSKPGLPAEEQRAELAELLDLSADLGMNAVVLQVRPACDALYRSELEPWSSYLTGEQGKAPDDDYDPLEWACQQAHRRGLEVHAWLNPYRANHPAQRGELAETHIARRRPDLVREYGSYLWLDPGEPDAAEHSLAVVRDIVRRYDVDAIHFDDYFYPYPVSDALDGSDEKVEVPFPDDPSWQKYLAATPEGERMSRDDWRRDNVNRFIQRCNEIIHEEKPHVRFGVSPFGIWRPGVPESIQGFDQYAKLYADAKRWINEGWVDYLTPQLYWPIEQKPQSFTTLLAWWATQNPKDRSLWAGLFTSKAGFDPPKYTPDEIPRQIEAIRNQPGADGHIHFSIKSIAANDAGVADRLAELYAEPALPPAAPWLAGDTPLPPAPLLEPVEGSENAFNVIAPPGQAPRWWLIQRCYGEEWTAQLWPGPYAGFRRGEIQPHVTASTVVRVKPRQTGAAAKKLVVTAIDAFGRLSESTCVDVSPVAVAP